MRKMIIRTSLLIALLPWTEINAQILQSQVAPAPTSSKNSEEIQRDQPRKVASNEILIPRLLGLSIATDSSTALSLQEKQSRGLSFHGLNESQQKSAEKIIQHWLAKPVTLDTLDNIARSVERICSPSGDSFITAFYPPQEITNGYIALVINNPILHSISFTGKPLFGKKFVSRALQSRTGRQASAEAIRKDIEFLNRNPFRQATALWSPAKGDQPAANLIIHLKEKRPWSLYTGFDNYASNDLGDERFYLGGKLGNVFGIDHRLGWTLLSSSDAKSLLSGNVTYEIPLRKHQLLHLASGYAESQTSSSSSLIDNNGEFFHLRAMFESPLPDGKGLKHHWKSGFSIRQNRYHSADNVTDITIFQWENRWNAEIADPYGKTNFATNLIWNPGHHLISSNDSTYASLGAKDSDSMVATLSAQRNISFGTRGNLSLRSEAQWAGENLLATNQFAAAGPQSIRGFDEGAYFYDKALMISTEYQWQRITLPKEMMFKPHIFAEFALLGDHNTSNETLSSVGIGLDLAKMPHYSARVDLAQPWHDPQNRSKQTQVIFSFNTFW